MSTPCNQEKRLERIENKIDSLLEFRHKVMGVIVTMNFVFLFFGWLITIIIKL